MCRLAVHLEYGLNVNALSLLHAARGWADSEPARVAIDMICRRRNLGTLQVNFAPPTPQGLASSAIKSVPDEVWQLVKQELTALAAQDARQAFLQSFRDVCHEASRGPHIHTESLADCDSCLFSFQFSWNLHQCIPDAYEVSLSSLRGDFPRVLTFTHLGSASPGH